MLVGGIGMALAMTPTTAAAMGSVPVDKAGVGSAVLNSMRQVGGSLGIAVMGAIIDLVRPCHRATRLPTDEFVNGFHGHALAVAAAIAFVAAFVAYAIVQAAAQRVRALAPGGG